MTMFQFKPKAIQRPLICSLGLLTSLGGRPPAALAESLADAVASAYQTNPTLQGARYDLKALDETDVQARAGFRPTAQVQITAEESKSTLGSRDQALARASNSNAPSFTETYPGQGQLTVQQPLYTGGRTTAEVAAADAQIMVSRQSLRGAEGDVILAVIQAYTGVHRDQKTLVAYRESVEFLTGQVSQTRARLQAGDATLTDVSQFEAQLEAERALYESAKAQLETSRLSYVVAVGADPGELDPEPSLPGLPATVDEAFDLAGGDDPEVRAAELTEQAAREKVVAARAADRPTLSMQGSYGYSGPAVPYETRGFDRTVTVEAVLTQPLFTGGLNESEIRQALAQDNSSRVAIETTRRSTFQNVANAWNQMLTAKINIQTQAAQVKAARTALNGMLTEYRVGQRSTLDVIVADQTLTAAEISLVDAEHDGYVGAATVLRYIGRLEARDLMRGAPVYDVASNLRHIKKIGSTPWEGVVEAIDGLAAPAVGRSPLAAPSREAQDPSLVKGSEPNLDASLADSVPISSHP